MINRITPRLGLALGVLVALLGFSVVGYSLLRRGAADATQGTGPAPAAEGASGTANPTTVHEHWIIALRDGDRPQALAAYAPSDLHDAAVDNQLQRMDSKLHSPSSTLGQLVQVVPEAPRVDGAQARGLSRWQFGNGTTVCFETKLNRDGVRAWFVSDYGTVPCP